MSKIFKALFLALLLVVVFSLLGTLVILQKASVSIGQPKNYILDTVFSLKESNKYASKEKINFIVLGLDKRDDLLEKTNTTDTIMFVSLNLKNQKINTISIPRDLWFYDINSKVNEIYPLSLQQPDQLGYIKDKFNLLINQPIDHVVILTTDNLIKFVNLIGGVDIYLENGFIDNQYPNPEYIKNPSSKIEKYKTIEFKSGFIHLDSSNVTEFVRSRKGGESLATGGTDLARIQRQQLLLESILEKVKRGNFVHKNFSVSNLYQFWNQEIIKDITDQNILEIFTVLGENIPNLSINKINIPVGSNSKNGLIYHPNSFFNKQWVFIPTDKEYRSFQKYISDSI